MTPQFRMLLIAAIVPFAICQAPAALAQQTKVTSLMAQPLPGFAGPEKEGSVALVEFPPGASSVAHRHNAHVFVYVLEGSLEVTLDARERYVLAVGDSLCCPGGVVRSWRNPGRIGARVIWVHSAPN